MPRTNFGKSRDVNEPYAVYQSPLFGGTTYHVLKTYKHSSAEAQDPYARWFVAGKSDMTGNSFEYGDMYKAQVLKGARLISADDQWRSEYE